METRNGNINILYMTEKEIKTELNMMAKYINGMQFNAIVIKKDNMQFIIVLN